MITEISQFNGTSTVAVTVLSFCYYNVVVVVLVVVLRIVQPRRGHVWLTQRCQESQGDVLPHVTTPLGLIWL